MNTQTITFKARAMAAGLAVSTMLAAAPAHAGLLGGLLERALEHHVAKALPGVDAGGGVTPQGVTFPSGDNFSECRQLFPSGSVIDIGSVNAQWKARALCASNYAVVYSATSKTPLVVVEKLDRAQLADALDERRTDEFYPDPRLKRGSRAELDDYAHSGFDRGHMAPAGDQPTQASMAQSFVLSNIVPQDPTNNRKVWSKIESDVRKFARRAHGSVYVFTGPLFRGRPQTIGRSAVWVPSHLFKLVYDEASGRSWAYILANTADARIEAPMDYQDFVAQTGWRLLPGTQRMALAR